MGLQRDVIAMLNENMPQEALEGASDGLTAPDGVPHPKTFDGALYEAYRAGWLDRERDGRFGYSSRDIMWCIPLAFRAWRRRLVELPETGPRRTPLKPGKASRG